ncbi:hypothetical protein ACFL2V_02850, partial [Pseudomonadota bacterium]
MKPWACLVMVICALLFMPVANSAEVKLRAGDVVFLELPGEAEFEKPFHIDRQGRVLVPEVG